jgi:hypothetical protein
MFINHLMLDEKVVLESSIALGHKNARLSVQNAVINVHNRCESWNVLFG